MLRRIVKEKSTEWDSTHERIESKIKKIQTSIYTTTHNYGTSDPNVIPNLLKLKLSTTRANTKTKIPSAEQLATLLKANKNTHGKPNK